MNRFKAVMLCWVICALVASARAADQPPLKLVHTIPLPQLHDGDFDHFTVDVGRDRLFSTAEENSKVLVLDLKTNKLIHTMGDLKAPHSMLYRSDLKKLFVVDSDLGEVKIYDTDSYKPAGSIKVREGADSSVYDPSTKLFYVVDVGKNDPHSYIAVIDTDAAKVVGEIKIDSDDVEAVAIEKSGPRLLVNIRGTNSVEVYDRTKRTLVTTWSMAEASRKPTPLVFDESHHWLFAGTRDPVNLLCLIPTRARLWRVHRQPPCPMTSHLIPIRSASTPTGQCSSTCFRRKMWITTTTSATFPLRSEPRRAFSFPNSIVSISPSRTTKNRVRKSVFTRCNRQVQNADPWRLR